MQPETEAEAKAWFQKAANDLRGADIDLAATPPLIEDALFHCQQAAEKLLRRLVNSAIVRRSRSSLIHKTWPRPVIPAVLGGYPSGLYKMDSR